MENQYLRHLLATIKYRFEKSLLHSADNFADFTLGKGSRSPSEIIRHMYEVIRWARITAEEKEYTRVKPDKLSLEAEMARFQNELDLIDQALAHKELPIDFTKKLIQGPFADLLTHIGQIAMLQRLDDRPIEGENFSAAEIGANL